MYLFIYLLVMNHVFEEIFCSLGCTWKILIWTQYENLIWFSDEFWDTIQWLWEFKNMNKDCVSSLSSMINQLEIKNIIWRKYGLFIVQKHKTFQKGFWTITQIVHCSWELVFLETFWQWPEYINYKLKTVTDYRLWWNCR